MIQLIKLHLQKLAGAITFLYIMLVFFYSTDKTNEKCSCGQVSKKVFLKTPSYKTWYNKNKHLLKPIYKEYEVTCFCGKEKIKENKAS